MIVAALAMWLNAVRPQILIAPEGEAVGIMTPAGRSLSKASGGAFVVKTWLLEDGDTATQEQAAARPAWTGDARDRMAVLSGGWQLMHFTGKGSGARAASACRNKVILVANDVIAGLGEKPACLVFDSKSLRMTGAVAIDIGNAGPMLRSATQTTAQSPWAGAD